MSTDASTLVSAKLAVLDAELPEEVGRVVTRADAEAVHDLRVTIRRIRTLLKLARPLYGRFHADAVRGSFASVQQATGALRDEEALEETIDALGIHSEELALWRRKRAARERRLRREAIDMLRRRELDRPRKLLEALALLPVRPKRDEDAETFARKAVKKAEKEVDDLRDVDRDDVEALHELRIAYKHLRYAIESFAEVLPADVAAARDPAKEMQKHLGEIHDIDMALVAIERTRVLGEAVRGMVRDRLREARARKVLRL